MELRKQVDQWLNDFARCVRERGYEEGKSLCQEQIVSYGTVMRRANGLEDLVSSQWQKVWERTEGFHFLSETAQVWLSQDESQITVAAEWESTGLANAGGSFLRKGRSTIVLIQEDGGLKAIHTHFSQNPGARFEGEAQHSLA